jgi:hypothetical protein
VDAVLRRFCCFDLENPMGEGKKNVLSFNFGTKLKLEFHEVKVTSDANIEDYSLENL